jgi:hypothetical protein
MKKKYFVVWLVIDNKSSIQSLNTTKIRAYFTGEYEIHFPDDYSNKLLKYDLDAKIVSIADLEEQVKFTTDRLDALNDVLEKYSTSAPAN